MIEINFKGGKFPLIFFLLISGLSKIFLQITLIIILFLID